MNSIKERLNKLSGWTRTGILLSFIWMLCIIGIAVDEYYFSELHKTSSLVSWTNNRPEPWDIDWSKGDLKKGDVFDPDEYLRSKGMSQKEIDMLSSTPNFRWINIGLFAVLPPAIVWIFLVALWSSITWVVRGFNKK